MDMRFLLMMMMVPFFGFGQVIDSTLLAGDYLIMSDGSRMDVDILEITDDNIIIKRGEKESKIPKKVLKDYYRASLSAHPWKYNEEGAIEYVGVVELPGVSSADVYKRAKLYFAEAWRDSKEVIQVDDKDLGLIVGKGYSKIYAKGKGLITVNHKLYMQIKIDIKEEKYRFTLSELQIENYPNQYTGYVVSRISLENSMYTDENIATIKNNTIKKQTLLGKATMLEDLENTILFLKKKMSEGASSDNW